MTHRTGKTVSAALAFLLFAVGHAAGVEFKTRTLAEKLAEPELGFLASFDQRHINADLASGRKKACSHADISLELRGAIGFDGNFAYVPNPDEELAFALKDNFDFNEGTLAFWFRCDEFDPADLALKKNIGLFNLDIPWSDFRFNASAYFFGGTLYIASRVFSAENTSVGNCSPVSARLPGAAVKRDAWNQLVWTWDRSNRHQFFFNGEPLNRATVLALPPGAGTPTAGNSAYMAFSCRVWGENQRPHPVALDDIAIYKRAFPEAEVQMRYQSLLLESTKVVNPIVLRFDGRERGRLMPPLLHCWIDARMVNQRPADAHYTLRGSAGVIKNGTVALENGCAFLEFDVPKDAADYTLEVVAGTEKASLEISTPDFSFIGRNPRRDVTPKPWIDPVFDAQKRTVQVWNRKYFFGAGPFPVRIVTDAGLEVLDKGPELYFDSEPVRWQPGETMQGKSFVELRGDGAGKNGAHLQYCIRLDFDGALKVVFTVNGAPKLDKMTLEWQVGNAARKYMLTPNYQTPTADGQYAYAYPANGLFRIPCMLWSASDQAGFCWMPENDANWIHSGNANAFQFNTKTGRAVVTMVAQPTVIPENAAYNAWFAATPTRPAPERQRGNYGRFVINSWWGAKDCASLAPEPAVAAHYIGHYARRSLAPYGMGHGQVLSNPMARYLEHDWDMPGCFVYNMAVRKYDAQTGLYEPHKNTTRIPSSNPCPSLNTLFNDWQVASAEKLLDGEYGDRVNLLYYDLGSPCFLCGNAIHGCAFKDKFGRDIRSIQISGFRDLYIRLLDLLRRHDGVELMTHAQDQFVPFVNGLSDWWLPGEQFRTPLLQDPYAYMTKLAPLFDTEFAGNVLGAGVMFYSWSNPHNRTPQVLESLMAMLMLRDIDWLVAAEHSGANFRLWDVFKHYGIHEPAVKVHRFDAQSEITADNAKLLITYYECPDNYKLAVIVNPTEEPMTAAISVKAPGVPDGTVYDEYRNAPLQLSGGRFQATVPARSFILTGLPAKPYYPLHDGFRWPWPRFSGVALSVASTPGLAIPSDDGGLFRSAPPALGAWPLDGDFCGPDGSGGDSLNYVRLLPVRSSQPLTATVWCRSRDAAPATRVWFSVTLLDDERQPVGETVTANAAGAHDREWEKLTVSIPAEPGAVWARAVLHADRGGMDSRVVFDDFTMEH
ncbi:MAG: hypothetical protein BWX73_00742 [Lentisphaerae bacterium ADurb.Bin082]|nr:MAG: hypothetical protein BWX73_00742 [Lentisphaerae bacterium ADurb.Bin082]